MSDTTTAPAPSFWSNVWTAAKGLAGSKKFQAAMLSGLVWLVGKVGFHETPEDLAPIVGPIWLYIFGQGLADFGKSAAQAQASSGALPAGLESSAAKP